VPSGYPKTQVRAHDHGVRSPFLAGHEGSIPFARSSEKSQLRDATHYRGDRQDPMSAASRAIHVPLSLPDAAGQDLAVLYHKS